MKKNLISCLTFSIFVISSVSAQTINPCGTYEAIDWAKKNIKGYQEKSEAKQLAIEQEYQSYLSKLTNQKSKVAAVTFTIPVVFHILHTNGPENISDAVCIAALAQVNKDYARLGSDTASINPTFKNLYIDAQMVFQLAKIDPYGNCTNGIVHHYDTDTEWAQSNYFGYKYSNDIEGRWRPSRYLNIYIVKNIIGSSAGIIVGYTYKPGSAPGTNCDAIVYRYDFLGGLSARSLSHEIGHWFGLSHTFGDSNNAGISCGNDDIADTPKTSGFFSTCPSITSLSVLSTKYSGFGIGADYKLYWSPSKDAPRGMYFAPGLSFSSITVKNGLGDKGTGSIFALKGVIGHQWIWKSGFSLDLNGGIAYYLNGDISVNGDSYSKFSGIMPALGLSLGYAW